MGKSKSYNGKKKEKCNIKTTKMLGRKRRNKLRGKNAEFPQQTCVSHVQATKRGESNL